MLNGQRVTMLVIGIILAVRLSPHDNIGLVGSKGNHVSHWDHPRPAWVLMSQVLLVEPGAEDGEGGGVLRLGLPPHRPVLAPQGVGRQQDRQLQLDRLLEIARSHDELKQGWWWNLG